MGNYLIRKPDKKSFLFIILILVSLPMLSAQNSDDLFSSVFGDSSNSIQVVPIPLYINNQYIDDVIMTINEQQNVINIEATKLMNILTPRIQIEVINKLQLEIDQENDQLELEKLNQNGLETLYNRQELTLTIEIPASFQNENTIDLKKNNDKIIGSILSPSAFSAYMNLYSSMNMNITGNSDDRDFIFPLNIGLDTAFNIKSFVLEGDILFSYKDQFTIPNWNARLVKDFKELNLRLKAGTITYPVTSLQGYVPLNGMTIGRNFGLNPYTNIQSLGKQSIILNAPSQIEIYVNGRLLKKLNLGKGRYDLENLQLDSGANQVEIKIKEISGREETIFFTQPFNINLLQKGIADFSTAFGIFEGNMENPYFSGYYRYGINKVFTLGANIQSDFTMFNSGISLLLGTNAGNFSLESSLSYDSGFDWAASFFYRYSNYNFPSKNNWSFSATYRGSNYNGLRLEKVNNTVPLRLSLYYGQILPGGINGGLTLNRNFKSGWNDGETEIGLHLSRHFDKGLLVNFYLNEKIEDSGNSDFSAGLTLTVNLQKRNETVTTASSWPGTAIESNWQKSSESRIPGYSLNGGISGLPALVENTPYGVTLGGEYRGYKFTSSFNHNSTFLNTNDITLHNSSINFNSAIVFADSTFAITRPVYDSFVIIKPSPSYAEYTIGINPEGKSYGALLNGKGNAVLPGFHSYRNGQIILEAIDLLIGYDLGDSLFTFLPEYKSGAVITTGTEAVIFAGGTLVDELGKKITLSAVALISLDDSSIEEQLFFTNRDGYFEIYGLYAGNWRLELLEDRNYHGDFTIPEGNSGYYELWNVQLIKEEK